MHSHFALRGMTDCGLACLGQSSEVLFDAQEDATCARLYARALLTDICPAGFSHRADVHKRRLALQAMPIATPMSQKPRKFFPREPPVIE
jgi:hypothetical protein